MRRLILLPFLLLPACAPMDPLGLVPSTVMVLIRDGDEEGPVERAGPISVEEMLCRARGDETCAAN